MRVRQTTTRYPAACNVRDFIASIGCCSCGDATCDARLGHDPAALNAAVRGTAYELVVETLQTV